MAASFEFHPNRNLITANENSVGKSTLVKLLFWDIGCEPFLETKWKMHDAKTILWFFIGYSYYEVMRYQDSISLKENNELINSYPKIS